MGESYTTLRRYFVNALMGGSEDQYERRINTAAIWVNVLCHVIKEARRFPSDRHGSNKTVDSKALEPPTYATILYFLSYRIPLSWLVLLSSICVDQWMISDDGGPDQTCYLNLAKVDPRWHGVIFATLSLGAVRLITFSKA
ncbi:hypothetical protein BS47DRAFT_1345288 [Hydnum rufescens UP504]|uniref:Uncharacterized protein n=1 Tax=Hydnum rufescens UP504 TaxID=1448309 RepID=A0A9P6AXC5_9AGAM|nr:hypothetical protein BS47DRAFT_1345288 [Hydnum rufescens UP504]